MKIRFSRTFFGRIAAMRFAEKNKILGSVLVGTYHTDIGDDNEKKSGYFNHPWNWQAIRNNQKWIYNLIQLMIPGYRLKKQDL